MSSFAVVFRKPATRKPRRKSHELRFTATEEAERPHGGPPESTGTRGGVAAMGGLAERPTETGAGRRMRQREEGQR